MSPARWQSLPFHVRVRSTILLRDTIALGFAIFLLCFTPTVHGAVGFTITPNSVSNNYNGTIALQVTGLSSGQAVVVQKFLDANTNGILDAPDILWEQFRLTDGQATVIGGVTNINVPGDNDTTAGQITSRMSFQDGDFSQSFVGKYLYKISSSTGAFSPLTNAFSVTNFPYGQRITGSIINSGTNVPNAGVILFPPPRPGHGLGSPVVSGLANNSGSFTIQAPVGTYLVVAFKSNFVTDASSAPLVTLASGVTVTTNITMTNATHSISGKIVDAANSTVGLPGLFLHASAGGLISAGYSTDTNGNFVARVRSGVWSFGPSTSSLAVLGYLGSDSDNFSFDTTTGSVSGVTIAFPKANALFYGTVKDDQNRPLAGVNLFAQDNNNLYDQDVVTFTNGAYAAGALGGSTWSIEVDNQQNPGLANYIFSQGSNVDMNVGQAVQYNFTGLLATNHISGTVRTGSGPISAVQVYAYATINGKDYQTDADTDAAGHYSVNVVNGNWSIAVNCQYGDNSLDDILGPGTYRCPDTQQIFVSNGDATQDFNVQLCTGITITSTTLSDAQTDSYYDIYLQAAACSQFLNWSLASGTLPSGMFLDLSGELYGMPDTPGTYHFSVRVTDGTFSADTNLSLTVTGSAPPLQVDSFFLPNGTNGIFYTQTLQASGGQPPYTWSIPSYSAGPPANLALGATGTLSGTPLASGTSYFYVRVTDSTSAFADSPDPLSITIVNAPLVITNVSLPKGTIGAPYSAQLGATGGQLPYNCWSLATGSAILPPGLFIGCGGLISGMPTTAGSYAFLVQANDGNFLTKTKPFTILINPKPTLSSASWSTNRFQMRLTGASNQNYTVQMATNLTGANWFPLFVTNNSATNSFLVTDPNATNKQRFYRILIGP